MIRIKWIIFLFVGGNLFAQNLHHQMISTQGVNKKLKNGMYVNQSIGQQSTIGNYLSSKLTINQGYIQSYTSSVKITPISKNISTVVYPNPFTEVLNFKFSSPIEGNVKITIFDMRGRLVFNQDLKPIQNILTVTSLYFSEGSYFVKLEAKDLIYSSQIIKIK